MLIALSWLNDFNGNGGFTALQDIILDCKMKYSTLFNNNTGTQYFNANAILNSTATLGGHGMPLNGNHLSSYNNNEFKDKDTQLIREIRFECIKTLKSFVNTKVKFYFQLIYL